MSRMTIRHALAADYEAVYGAPLPHAMRALAADLDGECVGLAGVYYVDGQVCAFSRAKAGDDGKPILTKVQIARGTMHVLRMFRRMGVPVSALAAPDIEGSASFLERCGFHRVAHTSQGEVFRFAPARHDRQEAA